MTLLLKPGSEPAQSWLAAFAELDPELEVAVWPDVGDPARIASALVASPPTGLLASLPNLELIVSLPAGLDHLFADADLPADVPITRCVTPDGDPMMTEFVLLHVLRHHRQLPAYLVQQRRAEWRKLEQPAAAERRVGIMGMGVLGAAAARVVAGCGFDVAGWSRTPKDVDGVASFSGADDLLPFLGRSDIVVSLLPGTSTTHHILSTEAFQSLPAGAAVISAGRGHVVDDAALLAALDAGHLSGATLDVTSVEPLPADSPLWAHPLVTITPHIASFVRPTNGARVVVENLRRLRSGEPLLNLVDRTVGY